MKLSFHGPTHSVASIAPETRFSYICPPGRDTGEAPSLAITSPPRPGIRIFRPLKSSAEFISLRNQPPICTPVLPQGRHLTAKLPASSSCNFSPPPKCHQALYSVFVRPKGTAAK